MMAEDFDFRLAGPELLAEVLRFRESVYAQDLGHIPRDGNEAVASHFVAQLPSGGVVACFRLLGPEARPFDFESSVDLDRLLGPGARPALVGRLCVHPSYRNASRSIRIHDGLLRLVLRYAADQEISDLLLYTYDNLRRFYRAARFVDTQLLLNHSDWGTIHLMRRHLAGARILARPHRENRKR
jgi:predicted GNAT family N-acyltransferase